MPEPDGGPGPLYDRFYFGHYRTEKGPVAYGREEEWINLFAMVADRICTDIAPRTVLDAGCAMGLLVEALRDRGVEAFGVDISEYAIQKVREDIKPHCWVGSVTDELKRDYDLIVNVEVLEHLQPQESERAVDNFCAHSKDILFSSTPLEFKEDTHFNVRPPEYWAQLFARHGFFRDFDYDPTPYLTPWAVRYRLQREPVTRIAAGYERLLSRLKYENHSLREAVLERREELDRTLGERDGKGSDLARVIEERDRTSNELARATEERDRAVAMRAESLQHVAAMQNTLVWRVAERLRRSRGGRAIRALRPRR